MSNKYNNEIEIDFRAEEVQGNKYTNLINKAYDQMNKADFKDFTLEVVEFMVQRMNTLEEDCDRLEEAANEAIDELEKLAGKFHELLEKYIDLLHK